MRRFGATAALFLVAGIAVGGVFAGPVEASGGGGCGLPATDAHGTHVRIKNFCFTQTRASASI